METQYQPLLLVLWLLGAYPIVFCIFLDRWIYPLGSPITYYYFVMWCDLFCCVFMKVRSIERQRWEWTSFCVVVVLCCLFCLLYFNGVFTLFQYWNQNITTFIAMAQTQVILTSVFLLSLLYDSYLIYFIVSLFSRYKALSLLPLSDR